MPKRRNHSSETKARIVLEIISGSKSVREASRDYQIKDSLLYRWRDEFVEGGTRALDRGQPARHKREAAKSAELERLVGKLTMQLEIAKKASHYVRSLPLENELL